MSGVEKTNWEEQLLVLRGLTATTKALHEAQVLQLKMWGGVAFTGMKWKAEVDTDTKTVRYLLNFKKAPKNLPHLVASLDISIHWLLGDDWALMVSNRSQVLYRGARSLKDVNEQRKPRTRAGKPSHRS